MREWEQSACSVWCNCYVDEKKAISLWYLHTFAVPFCFWKTVSSLNCNRLVFFFHFNFTVCVCMYTKRMSGHTCVCLYVYVHTYMSIYVFFMCAGMHATIWKYVCERENNFKCHSFSSSVYLAFWDRVPRTHRLVWVGWLLSPSDSTIWLWLPSYTVTSLSHHM